MIVRAVLADIAVSAVLHSLVLQVGPPKPLRFPGIVVFCFEI